MASTPPQTKLTEISVALRRTLADLCLSDDRLQRIDKGGTSHVWLHDAVDGPSTILKASSVDRGTPLFPNDPRAEWEAMKRLSSKALSPFPLTIRALEGGTKLLVSQYLQPEDPMTTEALAALLRRVHKTPGWAGLARRSHDTLELRAQGVSMLSRSSAPAWLMNLAPKTVVETLTSPLVLVHRDLVPANAAMLATGAAVALDWQCPALGDPCEDIAHATSPGMQSLSDTPVVIKDTDLLRAYGDAEVSRAYTRRAPFYRWRMACYCQWQLDRGQQDYAAALDRECTALEEARERADRAR